MAKHHSEKDIKLCCEKRHEKCSDATVRRRAKPGKTPNVRAKTEAFDKRAKMKRNREEAKANAEWAKNIDEYKELLLER